MRQALLTRARNPEATIRERGTAAMGLWQRAIADKRPDMAETEKELRSLLNELNRVLEQPGLRVGVCHNARESVETLG